MRLLPYERLTLQADSPPEVVAARLARMVATRRFYLKQPSEPFRGSIQGGYFKVRREMGPYWHNSFLPIVIGDIAATPLGRTEVRVRMRMFAFTTVFVALWFGFLFLGTAVLVWTGAVAGGLLMFAAMALPAYLLMSWGFWTEVKKARMLLSEGLGCREAGALSASTGAGGAEGPPAGAW